MTSFYREKLDLEGHRFTKIFLAEGTAEALFLNTLFTLRQFNENEYCIFCIKGLNNLKTSLKILNSREEFEQVKSLGIMVDADSNPQGRMASVLQQLCDFDLSDKNFDLKTDTTYQYKGRRIGVFISPGAGKKGRIENMIAEEIIAKDEYTCISNYMKCLDEKCNRKLDEKALVQIFISSNKSDLCGTGRGFEVGILDVEHKAYESAVTTFTSI
jgi:hypothetical protein